MAKNDMDILLKVGFDGTDVKDFTKTVAAALKQAMKTGGKAAKNELNNAFNNIIENAKNGKLSELNFNKDLSNVIKLGKTTDINSSEALMKFSKNIIELSDSFDILKGVLKNVSDDILKTLSKESLEKIKDLTTDAYKNYNDAIQKSKDTIVGKEVSPYSINMGVLARTLKEDPIYNNNVTDKNIEKTMSELKLSKDKAERYEKLKAYYQILLKKIPTKTLANGTSILDFSSIITPNTTFNKANLKDENYKNLINTFKTMSDTIPMILTIGNEIQSMEGKFKVSDSSSLFGEKSVLDFGFDGSTSFTQNQLERQINTYLKKTIQDIAKQVLGKNIASIQEQISLMANEDLARQNAAVNDANAELNAKQMKKFANVLSVISMSSSQAKENIIQLQEQMQKTGETAESQEKILKYFARYIELGGNADELVNSFHGLSLDQKDDLVNRYNSLKGVSKQTTSDIQLIKEFGSKSLVNGNFVAMPNASNINSQNPISNEYSGGISQQDSSAIAEINATIKNIYNSINKIGEIVGTAKDESILNNQLDSYLHQISSFIKTVSFAFADKSSIQWHNGNLDNLDKTNKSETFGSMVNGLEFGGLGTWGSGLYTTSNLEDIQNGENFYAVDLSKYKLFKNTTEEEAKSLHEFLTNLEKLSLSLGGFSKFDNELDQNNIDVDSLYENYKNIFKNAQLTYEQFDDFMSQMADLVGSAFNKKGEIENSKLYHSDSISTRFMKLLGYEGIDNSGLPNYDNVENGSVIYDIDKNSPYVDRVDNLQDALNLDVKSVLSEMFDSKNNQNNSKLTDISSELSNIANTITSNFNNVNFSELTSRLDNISSQIQNIEGLIGKSSKENNNSNNNDNNDGSTNNITSANLFFDDADTHEVDRSKRLNAPLNKVKKNSQDAFRKKVNNKIDEYNEANQIDLNAKNKVFKAEQTGSVTSILTKNAQDASEALEIARKELEDLKTDAQATKEEIQAIENAIKSGEERQVLQSADQQQKKELAVVDELKQAYKELYNLKIKALKSDVSATDMQDAENRVASAEKSYKDVYGNLSIGIHEEVEKTKKDYDQKYIEEQNKNGQAVENAQESANLYQQIVKYIDLYKVRMTEVANGLDKDNSKLKESQAIVQRIVSLFNEANDLDLFDDKQNDKLNDKFEKAVTFINQADAKHTLSYLQKFQSIQNTLPSYISNIAKGAPNSAPGGSNSAVNNFETRLTELANDSAQSHKQIFELIDKVEDGGTKVAKAPDDFAEALTNAVDSVKKNYIKNIADTIDAKNASTTTDSELNRGRDILKQASEKINQIIPNIQFQQDNATGRWSMADESRQALFSLNTVYKQLLNQAKEYQSYKGNDYADTSDISRVYNNFYSWKDRNSKAISANPYEYSQIDKILSDTDKVYKYTNNELDELQTRINKFEADAAKAGNVGKNLFDNISSRAGGIAQLVAQYTSLQDFIRYLQDGISVIKQYDSAITEMSKVSNESKTALENYAASTGSVADKIGTTALTLQNSTASWMRLGYAIKDAGELAKNSSILYNVSEFQTIDNATDALVSMIQAFKNNNQDLGTLSTDIIDKMNNIGNNYAISTSGLAESLQRSAGTLVAAGNDINKAIALTTAANSILQDPDSVAAGLRTISLRIRGTSVKELENAGEDTDGLVDTTSKLAENVKKLTAVNNEAGVSILDMNGNYKDTYTILQEIADKWEDIGKADLQDGQNRQAALLEMLAGKNRSAILAAILQNPDILHNVYKDALNSQGSAAEENEKYLNSIAGHQEKLTNSIQEMWKSSIDSDVIKFFIDVANQMVKLVDKVGLLKFAFIGLSATWNTMKKEAGASNLLVDYGENGDKIRIKPNENSTLGLFKTSIESLKSNNNASLSDRIKNAVFGTQTYQKLDNEKFKQLIDLDKNDDKYQENFENLIQTSLKSQDSAEQGFGKYLAQAKQENINYNDYSQYIKSANIQLKQNTLASKAATVATGALNFALSTLASIGFTLVISAIADAVTSQQRFAESFRNAGDTLKDSVSGLNDYQDKITQLRATIEDQSSSIDEVTQARQELSSIQQEMIKQYGTEADTINLVTDAVNGQSDAFEQLGKKQYQKQKNEINNSRTTLGEKIQGFFGDLGARPEINDYNNADPQRGDERNKVEVGQSKYYQAGARLYKLDNLKLNDRIKAITGADTDSEYSDMLSFSGQSAEEALNKLYQVQDLVSKYDDVPKKFTEQLTREIGTLQEISVNYGEMAKASVLYDNIFNDSNLKSSYNKLNTIADNYREAFAKGDEGKEDAQQYAEQYVQELNDALNAAKSSDVKTYFEDMNSDIKSEIGKINFSDAWEKATDPLVNDVKNLDLSKYTSEYLNNLNLTKGNGLNDQDYKVWSSLNDAASKYELTVSDLIDLLKNVGKVQTENQKIVENIVGKDVYNTLSKKQQDAIAQTNDVIKVYHDAMIQDFYNQTHQNYSEVKNAIQNGTATQEQSNAWTQYQPKMSEIASTMTNTSFPTINKSLEDSQREVSTYTSDISTLTDAIADQNKNGYISETQFKSLADIYDKVGNKAGKLSDYYKITAQGIQLNLSKVRELLNTNQEQAYNNIADSLKNVNSMYDQQSYKLEAYKNELNSATGARKDALNSLIQQTEDSLSSLDKIRGSFAALRSQLTDLTQEYTAFQDALSSPNAGANYDSMISNFKTIEDEASKGEWGTDEMASWIKYWTGNDVTPDMNNKQRKAAYLNAKKNYEKYGSSDDDTSVNNLWNKLDKTGYVKNGTLEIEDFDKAAKDAGISVSALADGLMKMKDFNWKVDFNTKDLKDLDISSKQETLDKLGAQLQTLEKAGATTGDTYKNLKAQYDSLASEVHDDKLIAQVDVDFDTAYQEVTDGRNKMEELLKENGLTLDNVNVTENGLVKLIGVDDPNLKATLQAKLQQMFDEFKPDADKAGFKFTVGLQFASPNGTAINDPAAEVSQQVEDIKATTASGVELPFKVDPTDEIGKGYQKYYTFQNVLSKGVTIPVKTEWSEFGSLSQTTNGNDGSAESQSSNGSNGANGGVARADGTFNNLTTGKTLLGEEGTELVVDRSTGAWHTVDNPRFENLDNGDIVFNAQQTKDLLSNGHTSRHGKVVGNARANGQNNLNEAEIEKLLQEAHRNGWPETKNLNRDTLIQFIENPQFGNINMSNREVLANGNGYSTVEGASDEFNGFNVAYTQYQQTGTGTPIWYEPEVVQEYLGDLASQAKTPEELLALDKVGKQYTDTAPNGTKQTYSLNNLIGGASYWDDKNSNVNAIGELMHYVGEYYDDLGLNNNYNLFMNWKNHNKLSGGKARANGQNLNEAELQKLLEEAHRNGWAMTKNLDRDTLARYVENPQFGNINMSNREVLENGNGYSTVEGASDQFKNFDVAYTQYQQTGTGTPIWYESDVVKEYLNELASQATTPDQLLALDKIGKQYTGNGNTYTLSNLIGGASIMGDQNSNVDAIGELMHYVGEYYDDLGLNNNFNEYLKRHRSFANGQNTDLVGELGPEIKVHNGEWSIIGENGPEFTDIAPTDIVIPADKTKELLSHQALGNSYASGKSYAFAQDINVSAHKDSSEKVASKAEEEKAKKKDSKATKEHTNAVNKDTSATKERTKETQDWADRAIELAEKANDRMRKYAQKSDLTPTDRKKGYQELIADDYKLLDERKAYAATRQKERDEKFNTLQKIMNDPSYAPYLNGQTYESILADIRSGSLDINKYKDIFQGPEQLGSGASDAQQKAYSDGEQRLKKFSTALKDAIDANDNNTKAMDDYSSFLTQLKEDQKSAYEYDIKIFDDTINKLQDKINSIQTDIDIKGTSGRNVSAQDYRDMIDSGYDEIDTLESKLERQQSRLSDFEEGSEDYENILDEIGNTKSALQDVEKQQAEWNKVIEEMPLNNLKTYIDNLKSVQSQISNLTDQLEAKGDTATANVIQDQINVQNKLIDQYNNKIKELTKLMQNVDPGSDRWDDYFQQLTDTNNAISELVVGITNFNKQMLGIPVDKLTKTKDVLSKINSALTDTQNDHLSVINAAVAVLQQYNDNIEKQLKDQTKPLSDELDLLQKQNTQRERQLQIEQARYNLEKALNQKTVQVIRNGRVVYDSDAENVRNAQNELQNAEYNDKTGKLQDKIDQLQDDAKKLEDANNDAIEKWQKIQSDEEYREKIQKAAALLNAYNAGMNVTPEEFENAVKNKNDNQYYNPTKKSYEDISQQIAKNVDESTILERMASLLEDLNASYIKGEINSQQLVEGTNAIVQASNNGFTGQEELTQRLTTEQLRTAQDGIDKAGKQREETKALIAEIIKNTDKNNKVISQNGLTEQSTEQKIKELLDQADQAYREARSNENYDSDSDRSTLKHKKNGFYADNDATTGPGINITNGNNSTVSINSNVNTSSNSSRSLKSEGRGHVVSGVHKVKFATGIQNGIVGGMQSDEKYNILEQLATRGFKPSEIPSILDIGEVVLNQNQQSTLLSNVRSAIQTPANNGTIINETTKTPNITLQFGDLNLPNVTNGKEFAESISMNFESIMNQHFSKFFK